MSNTDDDAIDFSAYDAVFKEASKDGLTGKHNFMVVGSPVHGAWNDGRARIDVNGVLTDVGSMKFSFSVSALDTPQAIKDEPDTKIKRSKVLNAQHWAALAKIGLRPDKLKDGDEFQVDLYREKPKPGYDTGFLRLRTIVGPVGGGKSKDDADTPF